MQAREIREVLQGKVDPKLIHCMCLLAENASVQKQEIVMLAESLDRLTNILLQLGTVTEATANAMADLKKIREG